MRGGGQCRRGEGASAGEVRGQCRRRGQAGSAEGEVRGTVQER